MSDVERVFKAVDSLDADALGALLAPDARMVFGNAEPLVGREAVLAGCRLFGATIAGLRHQVQRQWVSGPDTIAETAVTYTRLDGSEVTVPAVSIWRVGGSGLIEDFRIFYDLSPLYGG